MGGGLPGGDLTGPGLDHLSHQDVLDLLGLDAGALQGTGDGETPELGGREPSEST